MANRNMYFGTQTNMAWIPCPKQGADMSRNRYMERGDNFNGSFTDYQSASGAQTYEFDFGLKHREDIQHLLNIDSGLYGRDVYFLDPFAMSANLLPAHWAAPFLAYYRAPNLMGKDKYKQAVTPTLSNTYGYPDFSAVLGADDGNEAWTPSESLTLWIPVPSGYTFHFGAHSHDTASNDVYVGITPDGDTEDVPTLLANNVATLTNYTYTPVSNSGVTLQLNGDPESTSYISGMIAQVLPVGTAAPTGNFIAGQGHSGCHIMGGVKRFGYSVPLDWQQFSVTLNEFGNWADD